MTTKNTHRSALRHVAVLLLSAFVPLTSAQDAPQAASNRQRAAQAEALTGTLIDLSAAFDRARPAERSRALGELLDTAAERRDLLASLIEDDPSAALRAALPSDARGRMPAEVQDFLEQRVELAGELQVFYEDARSSSRLHYFLDAHGERFSLHFGAEPPGLVTGTAVRANGLALDRAVALESGETSIETLERPSGGGGGGSSGGTTTGSTPLPNTLGAQKTLVVLVNFQDNPVQPYTAADAQSTVFGTTSDFFRENSSGQTWLVGDVAGWFTIAQSSTVCDTSAIATQAGAAASAAGINLSAYAHLVYAFPQISCGWWGLSSVGGTPSKTWITGELKLGVTAHELGHSLGLFHSHALDCNAVTLGPSCATYEYGDSLDMMGASSFAHFNPFQKERLGWLNAGSSPAITTVTTDGTYTLDAYETAGLGPKALKILKSTDPSTGKRTWYYVHSRQAIGFDGGLAGNANVLDGVAIDYGTESNGNSSYLLDMTPASGSSIYYDWRDPALVGGQSFDDPAAGMSLTTEWITGTAAAVTVRFGAGSPAGQPALAVSTDLPSYSRSQTVAITAVVTSAGSPVANAAVSFTVTKANGSVVSGSATTGSDGTAMFFLRLRKQDPIGSYEAAAVATANSMSASASSTFTVK